MPKAKEKAICVICGDEAIVHMSIKNIEQSVGMFGTYCQMHAITQTLKQREFIEHYVKVREAGKK